VQRCKEKKFRCARPSGSLALAEWLELAPDDHTMKPLYDTR
jgi:hypothetical protein